MNYAKTVLANAGFNLIKETEPWNLEAGKGYYFTRNNTTLCAFLAGPKCGTRPIDHFKIVGCHTDSPCLKIAPRSKRVSQGLNQINVTTYGGGLWRTWFDRDLSLAGKVIVRDAESQKLTSHYWNAAKPLMKVASLAIHLDRSEEFKPNKETHLKPILCTGIVNDLFGEGVTPIADDVFQLEQRHMSSLT